MKGRSAGLKAPLNQCETIMVRVGAKLQFNTERLNQIDSHISKLVKQGLSALNRGQINRTITLTLTIRPDGIHGITTSF